MCLKVQWLVRVEECFFRLSELAKGGEELLKSRARRTKCSTALMMAFSMLDGKLEFDTTEEIEAFQAWRGTQEHLHRFLHKEQAEVQKHAAGLAEELLVACTHTAQPMQYGPGRISRGSKACRTLVLWKSCCQQCRSSFSRRRLRRRSRRSSRICLRMPIQEANIRAPLPRHSYGASL